MTNETEQKLPVTVIGGYLGSGKTTLVNHLLRHADGRRLAILVNEFGDLAIDGDLIEAEGDDLISLAGGCVCCSYGDDLGGALKTLAALTPAPDHVLLEASGVALPSAIAASLSLLSVIQLDAILVMVDAETILNRARDKYMGDTILRQMQDTDLVVINKVDLVDERQLDLVRDWAFKNAPNAAHIETSESKISSEVLFGFGSNSNAATKISIGLEHTHHHPEANFKTWNLDCAEPVDPEEFADSLIDENPNLVRAKGFLKTSDGKMNTLQIVGKRTRISDAPEGVEAGIVVIVAANEQAN